MDYYWIWVENADCSIMVSKEHYLFKIAIDEYISKLEIQMLGIML